MKKILNKKTGVMSSIVKELEDRFTCYDESINNYFVVKKLLIGLTYAIVEDNSYESIAQEVTEQLQTSEQELNDEAMGTITEIEDAPNINSKEVNYVINDTGELVYAEHIESIDVYQITNTSGLQYIVGSVEFKKEYRSLEAEKEIEEKLNDEVQKEVDMLSAQNSVDTNEHGN